jgi:RNA polymerase sigma factor (sigma-70 family)
LFDSGSDLQFGRNSSPRIVALCQAKQGVEARQRDIFDSHRHRAFALAYYMTGNEIEAEQILTSTFIRAFQTVTEPSGQDVDSALLEELRQRSHLHTDIAASIVAPAANPEQTPSSLAERNIKRTHLEEAVRDLPASERLLFLLRDVEGYSPAAIAQLLQMPEAQVQRGIFAARIRMRRILAETPDRNDEDLAA